MKGRKSLFAFVVVVALLTAVPAAAQLSTGSMAGRVQDPAGLAVVGVEVTVISQATNREFKTTTNEAGAFTIPSLGVGLYRIEVTAAGFRKAVVENVKVDTGVQTSVPPINIELGEVTETVKVESGTTIVQTTNAEIKDTVDAKQITALPLVNRNPLTLLGLQAGVNTLGRTNTVINGQRPSLTNLTMDGINIQDNFIRANSLDFTPNLPLLSQVAEFTVGTSNTGAESGLGASQVSLTTPSGTNDWRGEAFWNHRNNALAANGWFSNQPGNDANGNPINPKPFLILNQLGASVGGPIFKDKLFVYGYYEAFRQITQTLQNHTILTSLARQGMFTYLPSCTTTCPAGVTAGQPVTVNLLAARDGSRTVGTTTSNFTFGPFTVDPFVANLLSQVPDASFINNFLVGDSTAALSRNTAGYQYNKQNNRTRDNYGFKLDWNATTNHTFAGTWQWNRDIVDRNDIDGSFTLAPIVLNNDAKKLLSVTWRWTPSATFTNEVVGGFNLAPASFINSTDFAQNNVFTGFIFTNPNVTFRDQGRDTDTFNLQDNASWAKGKHFLKFGYSSQLIRTTPFNFAGANPSFGVGFATTNISGLASGDLVSGTTNQFFPGGISTAQLGTANSLLVSLAGILASGSQTFQVTSATSGLQPFTANIRRLKFDTHAFYVADSYRILPALTLNYGVRYEYIGRFDDRDGLVLLPVIQPGDSVLDTVLGDPTLDFAGGDSGRSMYDGDYNNFAPNVGFAWDVFQNGKTSLRGGYSVHFVNDEGIRSADNASSANQGLVATSAAPPLAFANNLTISSPALPTFATPAFQVPRLASDNNAQFGSGFFPQTIFTIDPNLRAPYVQEWNLGIQHEIGWNTVVDVHYIGNKGTKLYRGIDYNQVEIFSNGFLDDFLRARSNGFIALNTPATTPGCTPTTCGVFRVLFNANLPGSQPLTILPSFGLLTNSTIVSQIRTGQPGDLAFTYHSNGFPGNVQLVPNPVAGVADILTNGGDSTYHAGVVEVRRRFSKGLGFQANYVWGKVLSDVAGNGGVGQTRFDPYTDINNARRDRSRALFDVTHQFKANFVYELPAGRGHWFNMNNVVVEKILSGWTIGSVFNWQSGHPFSIDSGRGTINRSGRCSGRCSADSNLTASQIQDLVGVFYDSTGVYMINPSVLAPDGRGVGADANTCTFSDFTGQAFCNPAPGTLGNLQQLAFNGPSLFTWDFSVIKETPITERIKFEYRAEFFNFLNHPVFSTNDEGINSTQFGRFTAVDVASRRIQMTLRLIF